MTAFSVSIGIAQGPEHAMNPRELVACAEIAMMTAKARGKSQAVLFEEHGGERPGAGLRSSRRPLDRASEDAPEPRRKAEPAERCPPDRRDNRGRAQDARRLPHRLYVVDGDDLIPVAWRGDLDEHAEESVEALRCKIGEGITGRAASTGESILLDNALDCDFAETIPGTDDVDESMIAVPLRYGARVIGAVVISKLGVGQFDEDDVRLLEVLGGHASVAVENARLYEAERLEAHRAKDSLEIANALLDFSHQLAAAESLDEVLERAVELSARLLHRPRSSLWLQESAGEDLRLRALVGFEPEDAALLWSIPFPHERAREILGGAEPFQTISTPVAAEAGISESPDRHRPLADRLGQDRLHPRQGDGPEDTFDDRSMRLLAGVAHQVKLAIANVSNFESLERTFLSTVEALANALEANDEYVLPRPLDQRPLPARRPRARPRRTDTEATRARRPLPRHREDRNPGGDPDQAGPARRRGVADRAAPPRVGARILAPIERLEEVCEIVLHCHEHWDGSGYPNGLAGEEIRSRRA